MFINNNCPKRFKNQGKTYIFYKIKSVDGVGLFKQKQPKKKYYLFSNAKIIKNIF